MKAKRAHQQNVNFLPSFFFFPTTFQNSAFFLDLQIHSQKLEKDELSLCAFQNADSLPQILPFFKVRTKDARKSDNFLPVVIILYACCVSAKHCKIIHHYFHCLNSSKK